MKLSFIAAFFIIPFLSFGQIEMTKITLMDSAVEVSVPRQLTPMPDSKYAIKYPGHRKPALVLSDGNAEVNLIANINNGVSKKQLEQYLGYTMKALKTLHPDIRDIESEIKTINGEQVAIWKFTSQATDTEIFDCYFITVVKNTALVFTFNCIMALKDKWENTLDDIISSVKVKG